MPNCPFAQSFWWLSHQTYKSGPEFLTPSRLCPKISRYLMNLQREKQAHGRCYRAVKKLLKFFIKTFFQVTYLMIKKLWFTHIILRILSSWFMIVEVQTHFSAPKYASYMSLQCIWKYIDIMNHYLEVSLFTPLCQNKVTMYNDRTLVISAVEQMVIYETFNRNVKIPEHFVEIIPMTKMVWIQPNATNIFSILKVIVVNLRYPLLIQGFSWWILQMPIPEKKYWHLKHLISMTWIGVALYRATWTFFKPTLEKWKKKSLWKIFYIVSKKFFLVFREMELYSLNYLYLRRELSEPEKQKILYISLKKFSHFGMTIDQAVKPWNWKNYTKRWLLILKVEMINRKELCLWRKRISSRY